MQARQANSGGDPGLSGFHSTRMEASRLGEEVRLPGVRGWQPDLNVRAVWV